MKKYKIVSYKRFICSQLVMMLILFVTISNLKQVCANVLQEKTAQHKIQIQNTVSTQEIYVEKKFQLANRVLEEIKLIANTKTISPN